MYIHVCVCVCAHVCVTLFLFHSYRDSSIYSGHLMKPVKEEAGGRVTPTTANSLPVWVDWVELYCTHVSKAPEEGVPFSSQ